MFSFLVQIFITIIFKLTRPTAGGPGAHETLVWDFYLAHNGSLPATLPEPIKRARDQDTCGFAGEGNVVERSERYASVAKPKGP
jgi:hypothetical protein